jgi:predicted phosphodiesterase
MNLFNNGKKYNKILVLPDMHIPFMDWAAVKLAANWVRKHEPDLVIQLGDLFDQKAWSKFPKEPDDLSPNDEIEITLEAVKRLNKMFPEMQILFGNHDLRISKKSLDVGFTRHLLRDLQDIFPYDGWNWWSNPREKLVVNTTRGPILFVHGDEDKGDAVSKSRLFGLSVVQGHDHQFKCSYTSTLNGTVFGLSSGHLMDQESKGARYANRQGKYPVKGFTIIKYGIPYFLPITGDLKKDQI